MNILKRKKSGTKSSLHLTEAFLCLPKKWKYLTLYIAKIFTQPNLDFHDGIIGSVVAIGMRKTKILKCKKRATKQKSLCLNCLFKQKFQGIFFMPNLVLFVEAA